MRPNFCARRKSEASLSNETMNPDLIVIRSVSLQDTVQVRFAEHDEVVERFATDRSDEPLNVAALPRRAWCARVISDLHLHECGGGTPDRMRRRGRASGDAALRPRETRQSPDLRSTRRSDCSSR